MAKALECDLCGKLESGDPVALLTLESPKGCLYMMDTKAPEYTGAELCVACLEALVECVRLRRGLDSLEEALSENT